MRPVAAGLVHLRWSLALFVALVALGVAALLAARQDAAAAAQAHRAARAERTSIQARLVQAEQEGAAVQKNLGRYRELLSRVRAEDRLEWVERIEQMRSARQFIDLRYELAPEQALDGKAPRSGHRFMVSTMKLRMQLLHEEDLLGFLRDLAGGGQALLRTRACSVERLPAADGASDVAPRLKAECAIDWISLTPMTSVSRPAS